MNTLERENLLQNWGNMVYYKSFGGCTMQGYTIILDPDFEEGGYTVTVAELPGCITQGETIEECIERVREAIEGYLESLELP